MKPDIEALRKKYMDNPPEGMTSQDIRIIDVYKRQFQGRPAKARGNAAELHLSVRLRRLAIFQLFIAFQTRFLLCRTRPRAALYPCKLCPKDILAL